MQTFYGIVDIRNFCQLNGFACGHANLIDLQTLCHNEHSRTVFHRCANASDLAIARGERIIFRKRHNCAIVYGSIHALPVLALIHTLCHKSCIFWLIANPNFDEFVCVVTNYLMSHIVYRIRCMCILIYSQFAVQRQRQQWPHQDLIFALSDRRSRKMLHKCTQRFANLDFAMAYQHDDGCFVAIRVTCTVNALVSGSVNALVMPLVMMLLTTCWLYYCFHFQHILCLY